MKSIFLFLFASFLLIAANPASNDQIIVFLQEGKTISEDFRKNSLPDLQAFADKQEMDLKVVNINKDGAPEEISITPMVTFQNYLGRSFFKGRYTMPAKIQNFVRTVKRVPQAPVEEVAGKNPVWQDGRSLVRAKLKITPPGGTLPSGFEEAKFLKKGYESLICGFEELAEKPKQVIGRNDRTFYLDVHPYIAEDQKMYISTAIYSMFNCIVPVHQQFEVPIEGTYKQRDKAFKAAGAYLEGELKKQLANTANGDAFEFVGKDIKQSSWENLNLILPEKPEGTAHVDASAFTLSQNWEIAGPIDESTPMIQFNFPAPVDHYAGEVTGLEGKMTLSEDLSFKGVKGAFSAQMELFTMGDQSLDDYLLKTFKVNVHPKATVTFLETTEEDGPLAFGKTNKISIKGEMAFMGIKDEVNIMAQIEPILDQEGNVFLQVYAAFQMRLMDPFDISGPDGPSPANDTVVFNLNFRLK